jgi:hypothetical protein
VSAFGAAPQTSQLLTYISEAPASELRDLAASLGPDAEEAYMTTAEMLRTEGEARGRTEALVQVLTVKFGTLPEDVPAKVRAASSRQVQEWTARAVIAEKHLMRSSLKCRIRHSYDIELEITSCALRTYNKFDQAGAMSTKRL